MRRAKTVWTNMNLIPGATSSADTETSTYLTDTLGGTTPSSKKNTPSGLTDPLIESTTSSNNSTLSGLTDTPMTPTSSGGSSAPPDLTDTHIKPISSSDSSSPPGLTDTLIEPTASSDSSAPLGLTGTAIKSTSSGNSSASPSSTSKANVQNVSSKSPQETKTEVLSQNQHHNNTQSDKSAAPLSDNPVTQSAILKPASQQSQQHTANLPYRFRTQRYRQAAMQPHNTTQEGKKTNGREFYRGRTQSQFHPTSQQTARNSSVTSIDGPTSDENTHKFASSKELSELAFYVAKEFQSICEEKLNAELQAKIRFHVISEIDSTKKIIIEIQKKPLAPYLMIGNPNASSNAAPFDAAAIKTLCTAHKLDANIIKGKDDTHYLLIDEAAFHNFRKNEDLPFISFSLVCDNISHASTLQSLKDTLTENGTHYDIAVEILKPKSDTGELNLTIEFNSDDKHTIKRWLRNAGIDNQAVNLQYWRGDKSRITLTQQQYGLILEHYIIARNKEKQDQLSANISFAFLYQLCEYLRLEQEYNLQAIKHNELQRKNSNGSSIFDFDPPSNSGYNSDNASENLTLDAKYTTPTQQTLEAILTDQNSWIKPDDQFLKELDDSLVSHDNLSRSPSTSSIPLTKTNNTKSNNRYLLIGLLMGAAAGFMAGGKLGALAGGGAGLGFLGTMSAPGAIAGFIVFGIIGAIIGSYIGYRNAKQNKLSENPHSILAKHKRGSTEHDAQAATNELSPQ